MEFIDHLQSPDVIGDTQRSTETAILLTAEYSRDAGKENKDLEPEEHIEEFELGIEGDILENVNNITREKDMDIDGMVFSMLLSSHLRRNKIL